MSLLQIISASIMSVIAIIAFTISYHQSKGKGFVFSNAWIYRAEKERAKINKQFEYRLAKNVFAGIGILFLLIAFHILTSWTWIIFPVIGTIIFIMIYAVIQSIKNGHFK